MTNVVSLAERLKRKIEWQEVPETMTQDDLRELIADAIRSLYVVIGKAMLFDESMFTLDEYQTPEYFADDLKLDESEWVLLTAQIEFYKKVQSSFDDLRGYSTDAMSVTHSDKPYENVNNTIARLESDRDTVWYRMIRYNTLQE